MAVVVALAELAEVVVAHVFAVVAHAFVVVVDVLVALALVKRLEAAL